MNAANPANNGVSQSSELINKLTVRFCIHIKSIVSDMNMQTSGIDVSSKAHHVKNSQMLMLNNDNKMLFTLLIGYQLLTINHSKIINKVQQAMLWVLAKILAYLSLRRQWS
jgi:hypothetical protein